MECGYLREWYPHKLPGAPQELCLQIDVVCRGPGFKYGTLSAVVLTAISFAAVRAKPLVLLFKRLIRQNNLDNTYLGGLSSQSLTRMALTYLQTCSLAPVTLEALLLGFSEHYPAGAHLEMFVDQRKMAELRCLFTLAGHTLCTEGLVAMLALTAK